MPTPDRHDRVEARWLLSELGRHWGKLARANALSFLATLLAVPIPLLLPVLVDEVLLDDPGPVVPLFERLTPDSWHSPVTWIALMVMLAALMRVGSTVLNILQTRLFTQVSRDLVYRLRLLLIGQVGRMRYQDWIGMGSGGLTSRLVTDLDTLDTFIGTTLSRLLISVLTVLGTAGILLWLHPLLGLFILLLNPAIVWLSMRFSRHVKYLKKEENQAVEQFQGDMVEVMDALTQLRVANREGHYLRKLSGLAAEIRRTGIRFAWRSDAANRASFTVFVIGIDFFRAAAMLAVLLSDLSVGQMFAIFGYLWFMMIPVQDVLNIQFQWFAARAALERIDRLLGLETEPHSHGHWTPGTRGLSLEVQRLGFAWPNGDQGIQDLGFSVPAGSGLGIVGASGGGKSTLIHLLLGLSPPDRGQIFWNGRPAEAIGLYALRRHIGVVLQDPVILNGTVRENLCLGLQVEEAVLWEAMKVVCIDTVVREMTDGLDTLLGRRGVRLSGGQRQRLALARVLIQQPACLILDEATSALDTRTEMQVLENLRQALPDATLIVVAHRLSALRFASQILVIEDGRMVEKGAPDELLQQDGVFRLLYGA